MRAILQRGYIGHGRQQQDGVVGEQFVEAGGNGFALGDHARHFGRIAFGHGFEALADGDAEVGLLAGNPLAMRVPDFGKLQNTKYLEPGVQPFRADGDRLGRTQHFYDARQCQLQGLRGIRHGQRKRILREQHASRRGCLATQ